MDFFMPIVTINENPAAENMKTNKPKKDKKEKKCRTEKSPAAKRKRGRPKKNETVECCPVEKPRRLRRSSKKPEPPPPEHSTKKGQSATPNGQGIRVKDEFRMAHDEDGQLKRNEIPPLLVKVKKNRRELAQIVPLLIKDEPEEEDTRTFPCPICKNETQRTLKDLRLHYKEDHKGKRLRASRFSTEVHPCDICGKEFKTNSSLKDHIETHNNFFQCEDCSSSHKKILDYVIHLRTHSAEGLFACLMCDFTTTEINTITNHINNNHEEGHKYWCESCKKGFHILSWFQEHDNYHTGLKPFDCDICGKCFLYSRYLYAHRNYMHKDELGNGPNFHECVICKKQYQHKNSLKLHMNSHTGNYAICDVCGKILSSKEKLKFHIRTHTGYKPFKCQYCDKCFTKKPILVEHIRIHTGERPYVCEYCTKAFSQRSSLVIHIRSHTGEKPYVCQFCQKGFVAKAMLNIHLKACKGIMM